MQFFTTMLAFATAALAANTIKFVNQDATDRIIYFTANAGLAALEPVAVPANTNKTVDIPICWIGNFFSVSHGAIFKPGMLGEVNFNSWGGSTYFDVSSIVDPSDTNGVQWLYPAASKLPASGCNTWPCNNVYNLPNDVQTKSTQETDLICILGQHATTGSKLRRHARDFRRAVVESIVGAAKSLPRSFVLGTNAQ